MPGLRLGYGLCGNESLMRRIREGIQPWNVSVVAQAAGCVAAKCTEFEIKTRKLLATEKLYLISELKKLDIKLYGYAANYIFFKADVKLGEKLRQKNIVIRDCSNYRSLSNGYYRIVVKNHEDNVKLINALKMCRENNTMAKSLMIQGTMSNAGKSLLTAGLLRVFKQDGYRAAPFKSQNMALNSYITKDGYEMGRAQVDSGRSCRNLSHVFI